MALPRLHSGQRRRSARIFIALLVPARTARRRVAFMALRVIAALHGNARRAAAHDTRRVEQDGLPLRRIGRRSTLRNFSSLTYLPLCFLEAQNCGITASTSSLSSHVPTHRRTTPQALTEHVAFFGLRFAVTQTSWPQSSSQFHRSGFIGLFALVTVRFIAPCLFCLPRGVRR